MVATAHTGRLAGIARRSARREPMVEIEEVDIAAGGGVAGDHKGLRFPNRGVTILALEDWERAIAELADLAGPVPLPWTTRRANLLVAGVALPRGKGSLVRIGPVRLRVTGQTYPCARMDQAHLGLKRALAPDWRGGVTCAVMSGGTVRIGDAVAVERAEQDVVPRLP